MSPRVLLCGYYGAGNAGDEAVLAATLEMFRARRLDLRFTALSADPAGTRASMGIDAAPRMRPAVVLSEIGNCDLFLSGGGSLLQDRTSLRSLLYYLLMLETARRLGKRTMVFAQGIGPLVRPAARRWTARVLSRVDAITVRDPDSAELLQSIGVGAGGSPPVEVTADPAFALQPANTAGLFYQRPAIAVSLRPWRGSRALLEPLAAVLEELDPEVAIHLWPLFPAEDLPECERFAARLPRARVLTKPMVPAEWAALAGQVELVIGMRLHALVFGVAAARPVAGISYDPKVDALLARLHSRPVGTASELDTTRLRAALKSALSGDISGCRQREALAAHLRDAAYRNVDAALSLL